MVDETLPDGTEIKIGDRLRTFPIRRDAAREQLHARAASRILHASIGRVYTPLDDTDPVDGRLLDVPSTRLGLTRLRAGQAACQAAVGRPRPGGQGRPVAAVRRRRPFEILERWDMKHELAEAGFPGMSSAVRPVAHRTRTAAASTCRSRSSTASSSSTPEAADLNGTDGLHASARSAEPATGAVTRHHPAGEPGARHALRAVRQRLRPPRHLDQRGRHARCASPARMDDYAALVDRATGQATVLRRGDDRSRLRQAVLDDRGPERHLLDLALRQRRGRRARHRPPARRSSPTCRSATTRSGCGTGTSRRRCSADW